MYTQYELLERNQILSLAPELPLLGPVEMGFEPAFGREKDLLKEFDGDWEVLAQKDYPDQLQDSMKSANFFRELGNIIMETTLGGEQLWTSWNILAIFYPR